MDSQNFNRKSLRNRQKSIVFKDYVVNEEYFDDDFVTFDEVLPEQLDFSGIFYT